MEVTEELIKNQKAEASQIDGKYTVLVSGEGATCNEYDRTIPFKNNVFTSERT